MKSDKIIAIICVIIMFAIGFGTLLSSNKEPELSEDENRMLEGMPMLNFENVIEGEFASDFEKYMIDRIPFRSKIINIQNSISQSMSIVTFEDTLNVVNTKTTQQMEGLDSEELVVPEGTKTITLTPEPKITPTFSDTALAISENISYTPEPTTTPDPNMFINSKYSAIGFIEEDTDKKTTLFRFETKEVIEFTDYINQLCSMLPPDGNLVYVFALESRKARPALAAIGQNKDITMFDENVEVLEYYTPDNVKIISAPVLFEKPLENDEQVYFFTDHHWTVEGIHYAYTEAMHQIGITPVKWEDYNVTYEYPFRGAYYRKDPTNYYIENPDTLAIVSFDQASTFTHYLGDDNIEELPILDFDASANDRYRIYYNGPRFIGPLSVIETTNNTDRNALIIIDSYGIPFSCMLIPHYDNICIMDLRYMSKSTEKYYIEDIAKQYDIDDIFMVLGDLNTYGSYYAKSLEVYMRDLE